MQELLEVLKSINFWTIVGSIAAVVAVILPFIQAAHSKKNKTKDDFISTVINLSSEYEKISISLLGKFENLSIKIESGTQNDDEGTRIQQSICTSALKLKAIRTELLNNTKNPAYQEQKINSLRDATENIFQIIVGITDKGGSLSMLSEAIETFAQAKNSLL